MTLRYSLVPLSHLHHYPLRPISSSFHFISLTNLTVSHFPSSSSSRPYPFQFLLFIPLPPPTPKHHYLLSGLLGLVHLLHSTFFFLSALISFSPNSFSSSPFPLSPLPVFYHDPLSSSTYYALSSFSLYLSQLFFFTRLLRCLSPPLPLYHPSSVTPLLRHFLLSKYSSSAVSLFIVTFLPS